MRDGQTKRGPDGRTVGIDGPEPRRWDMLRRWWTATEGIRFIVVCALVSVLLVVLMVVVSR